MLLQDIFCFGVFGKKSIKQTKSPIPYPHKFRKAREEARFPILMFITPGLTLSEVGSADASLGVSESWLVRRGDAFLTKRQVVYTYHF